MRKLKIATKLLLKLEFHENEEIALLQPMLSNGKKIGLKLLYLINEAKKALDGHGPEVYPWVDYILINSEVEKAIRFVEADELPKFKKVLKYRMM